MTNAELIKALRYCAEHEGCDYYIAKDCPIEDTWVCGVDCEQILMRDAADALEELQQIAGHYEQTAKDYWKEACEYKAQIPKEGEWIEQDDGNSIYHKCSVCGKNQYNVLLEMMQGDYHYCPNCGAKMKKGEQE